MTDPLSLDANQETKITILQLKVERLEEKQEDLRERLKAVEKWVIGAAAVIAAGITLIGFATNISKAYLCNGYFFYSFCLALQFTQEASLTKSQLLHKQPQTVLTQSVIASGPLIP